MNYEAPAVELEIGSEDVEREIYYAGGLTVIDSF